MPEPNTGRARISAIDRSVSARSGRVQDDGGLVHLIRSRGSALALTAALLVVACGGGGPDLTTHAGQHEFADEVCADIEAATADGALVILADAYAEARDAGTSDEEIRAILAEECPETLSEVEGQSGSQLAARLLPSVLARSASQAG